MNTELKEERLKLVKIKEKAASTCDEVYKSHIATLSEYAAADMALQEFDRKYDPAPLVRKGQKPWQMC
tara:strand:- start:3559 stop:3762 length:204 start_codon:yes stop_codon:yes gene_type:complete